MVIDAGPERAVNQVATVAEVINTMAGFGFDVVHVEQSRLVIAFPKRQSASVLAE